MNDKKDKFIKLSFQKRQLGKQETEFAHEITPLTKEEINRIKIRAQRRGRNY